MDERPGPGDPASAGERAYELRRHGRSKVSWPVVVEVGDRIFHLETVDVTPAGAKLRPREPLEPGTLVLLHFRPPEGRSLDVRAMVWRADPDGLVFFFMDGRAAGLASPAEPA